MTVIQNAPVLNQDPPPSRSLPLFRLPTATQPSLIPSQPIPIVHFEGLVDPPPLNEVLQEQDLEPGTLDAANGTHNDSRTPDVASLTPDAASLTPDVASKTPDVASLSPDVAPPHVDEMFQESPLFDDFIDYNDQFTKTFHMVCLSRQLYATGHKKKSKTFYYAGANVFSLPRRWCKIPQKVITIYDDHHVGMKSFKENLKFQLRFRPAHTLPQHIKIIESHTAFFLGDARVFEPTNFFHLTRQIFFPLHHVISSTNSLHPAASNVVFYPKPHAYCPGGIYQPVNDPVEDQFRQLLFITNRNELSAFSDQLRPRNACYKNAVFTTGLYTDRALSAIEYFQRRMGISDAGCTSDRPILTIINRKSYRMILNTDELRLIGSSLGYDTRVVQMETMSLKEQAQLVHCSHILAGVTGAGLQWAYFMKNYSGVIEIAWPHKNWDFFFTGQGAYQSMERDVIRPLTFVGLSNVTCHLNPRSLEVLMQDLNRVNVSIPQETLSAILQDERNYDPVRLPSHNAAKLYDVVVEPKAFKMAVMAAAQGRT